jgi:hypothetical protein
MKLRKAIKLAAAGAVVGASPMLAQAAPFDVGTAAGINMNNGSINVSCPASHTCDLANAITDDGFIMVQVTDTSGGTTDGNVYYMTAIAEDATSANEGVFGTSSLVGQETNVTYNNGLSSKLEISELGSANSSDDDFAITASVTTGAYKGMVTLTGADGATYGGMQKIAVDQLINDAANPNLFNTGFSFKHGMIMGTGDMKMYKDFDINLQLSDGTASVGNGSVDNTFQLLETQLEGTGTNSADSIVGKTLMIQEDILSTAETADTFAMQFIQNEAAGAATAGTGTVNAGPSGTGTITFSGGDTLAVKTLSQTMNGAAADFGLSDAANETTSASTGIDNFLGTTGMTATMDNTNLNDPFVTF